MNRISGVAAIILLLFFCFVTPFSLSAQQTFFNQVIDERAVPAEGRVSQSLRSNYHGVTYYREPAFTPAGNFQLQLPNRSRILVSSVRWYEFSNGSITYTGKISGQPHSEVTLALHDNRWYGMITDESMNKYMLQQTGDDVYAIATLNEWSYLPQETTQDFERPLIPDAELDYDVCAVDNPCDADIVSIQLMVVYTTAAREAYGGTASMNAAIATAVANMNVANTNSSVRSGIQFNLVYTTEVAYVESGSSSVDLSRLAGTVDGFMDSIHTLRNTYEADMVSMITSSPLTGCGLGYLNTNPLSYNDAAAFNITIYNCLVGNYTMAHEFGHNMGLRHDWYVDISNTPCDHHHGYVNQAALVLGASSTKRWRTVLAYNNQCADNGFNCSRVNYWSNPGITRTSDPMGISIGNALSSDEVYAINRFACKVASFRGNQVLPLTFIYTNAEIQNDQLQIQWKTENESAVEYFEAEVAIGLPRDFISKGSITARNQSVNLYRTAMSVPPAEHIFVRIKSVSQNGQVKYGSIVHVQNQSGNIPFARLRTNLVQQQLDVLVNSDAQTQAVCQIIDMNGKVMMQTMHSLPRNNSSFALDIASLTKGHYIFRISNGSNRTNIRFFKY
ncbi:MAG TPA: zinc-dependent metalloprotease [Ferruginibacter sp.]|nr:zinc-dependent metalloprotease [Ferruginibacter sp.]HRO06422.1 zinc-dependent metalloprotease [Ferruginibacter sp.]HRO96490.1 zinc-dependent metalloprotease [Ferruginibacter sp.]HRP50103.1 zinc-dependent metalloprotease [Ferruginibacter sp.]